MVNFYERNLTPAQLHVRRLFDMIEPAKADAKRAKGDVGYAVRRSDQKI